jgi:hypothetical protein
MIDRRSQAQYIRVSGDSCGVYVIRWFPGKRLRPFVATPTRLRTTLFRSMRYWLNVESPRSITPFPVVREGYRSFDMATKGALHWEQRIHGGEALPVLPALRRRVVGTAVDG